MKALTFFTTLFLVSCSLFAQDPNLSQPIAASVYYNPAFAGTADHARVTGYYRNHWASISNGCQSYNLNYDQHINSLWGGIGVFASYNMLNTGATSTQTIGAVYNYQLSITRKIKFRAGVKGSYNYGVVDLSNLKWWPGSPSEPISKIDQDYGDFGAGLLVNGVNFYGGFGVDHLFGPPETSNYAESLMPAYRKYVLQGGYLWNRSKDTKNWALNPFLVLQKQDAIHQVWPGLNIYKGLFAGGVSYRATRTAEDNSYFDYDALNFLVGFQKSRFKLGYGYDLTLPTPKRAVHASHELSLTFFLGSGHDYIRSRQYSAGSKMFRKMF